MIDNKTQRLALPLPNVDNYLEDDVARLSEALLILDEKVATVGEDGLVSPEQLPSNIVRTDENGKIPVDNIPSVAITDTFPVDSEAAMLALTAQPGDVAIRNDLSKSFILMAAPATMLGNWKEILNDALMQLAKDDGYKKVGGLDFITGAMKVEAFGFNTGKGQDISKLLNAFNQATELVFSKGTYYADDFTMPSTAKCKKIIIKPGSKLVMNGYSHVYNVTDNFTIDMTGGGIYDGGVKRATVTADCAVGVYDIPVDDASVFQVGDFITTSFLIPEPFDEATTPWNWANKKYNPNCNFNTIQAINGNVLTMKYPVEQRTLMRNVIVGNWQFSQNGIGFRGTGNVYILGGAIRNAKTRVMHIFNSVKMFIRGTAILDHSIDAIEVAHFADLTMEDFTFLGSVDFGKQGIAHTSAGNITLRRGYMRRGNFDVDIYPGVPSGAGVTQLGDVTVEDCLCVGTPLFPLTGNQVDTVTGKTANELFGGRINPCRTFYSVNPGAYLAPQTGTSVAFIAKNSQFLDYQRAVFRTEFSNAGNIRIRNMVFRDVEATCALFEIYSQAGYSVSLSAYELHNLKVHRRYPIQYSTIGDMNLDTLMKVTGGLWYNDAGIKATDHRLGTKLLDIDSMTIVGGGDVNLDTPMDIDSLTVRGSQVTIFGGQGQRNGYTKIQTMAGGSVTGPVATYPGSLQYLQSTAYSFVGASGAWVTIGKSSNAFTHVDVRVTLGPQQALANTNCVMGVIHARLAKDGTVVPVNYAAAQYLSTALGNLAYWEGHCTGSQGAIADGAVKLRCLSDGTIQININTSAGSAGVAMATFN